MALRFKTKRQEDEWASGMLDGRLELAIWALVGFVAQWEKHVTITDIWRSRSEAVNLNKLQKLPEGRVSPHEVWRAVDIRSADFTPVELAAMSKIIREGINYGGPRPVWYDAAHGTAAHVHLQVGHDPYFGAGEASGNTA